LISSLLTLVTFIVGLSLFFYYSNVFLVAITSLYFLNKPPQDIFHSGPKGSFSHRIFFHNVHLSLVAIDYRAWQSFNDLGDLDSLPLKRFG